MDDREQYSTSGGIAQADLDGLATELQAWRDIGVDVLEAAALSDEDGMRGCMGAIAERLRGQRAQVIVHLETTVQAPAPSITATYAHRPALEPTPAQMAQEETAAAPVEEVPTSKQSRLSLEARARMRESGRQNLIAYNERKRAEKAAQANGHAAPVVAPEPVQETPALVPTNEEIRTPVGERMEACAQEIRGLIAAGAWDAANTPHLAQRHNLSLHAVEVLTENEIRHARQNKKKAVTA